MNICINSFIGSKSVLCTTFFSGFVFLDDSKTREQRRELLKVTSFISRGIHKQNKKVVGIATEMKVQPICSYDFYLLDLPEWTEREQNEMVRLQGATGIFRDPKSKSVREDEYPQK